MVRFEDVFHMIRGDFVCIKNGRRQVFSHQSDLSGCDIDPNDIVIAIQAECDTVILELLPWQPPITAMDPEWVKMNKTVNGIDPSFF